MSRRVCRALRVYVANELEGAQMKAELQHAYLEPVREEYRRRTALLVLNRARVPDVAELFERAAAEHTRRLIEQAGIRALFLGGDR